MPQALRGPPGSAIGFEQMRAIVHPDDWTHLVESRARAIEENANYAAEYRVIWPDGSIRWIAASGHSFYSDDGVPLRFEGIVQDVTEHHELRQRQQLFMRDMLASVTDGKLTLCRSSDDLPPILAQAGEPIPLLAENGGIRELRRCTLAACEAANQALERCYDLQTAVGEAAMNAVVHADEGVGQIFSDDRGMVQVRISDFGKGISLENLPNATLKKGFTTAGTMGHGMKIMLQTADRVYLLTGDSGTTVVMEQEQIAPVAQWNA